MVRSTLYLTEHSRAEQNRTEHSRVEHSSVKQIGVGLHRATNRIVSYRTYTIELCIVMTSKISEAKRRYGTILQTQRREKEQLVVQYSTDTQTDAGSIAPVPVCVPLPLQ